MKVIKTVATIVFVLAAGSGAFAQGKVQFANDTLHLAFFDGTWAPSEQGPVIPTSMPGSTPIADLYMGTSSSLLALVTSAAFNSATPGRWNPVNVTAPFAGGSSVFVVTVVRDGTYAPASTWSPGYFPEFGEYYAASDEFNFTLGNGVSFPALYGANGNWAVGANNLDAYGTGWRGAIDITYIPEPSSIALAGIGVAGLRLFRKQRKPIA
jgi:hypothetical protein